MFKSSTPSFILIPLYCVMALIYGCEKDSTKLIDTTENSLSAISDDRKVIPSKTLKVNPLHADVNASKTKSSVKKAEETLQATTQTKNKTPQKSLDLSLDELTLSSIKQNSLKHPCKQGDKDCAWLDKKAALPDLFSQKESDSRFHFSGDIERDKEKELLDIKAITGGEVSVEYKFE